MGEGLSKVDDLSVRRCGGVMSDLNDPRVFFAAERTLLAWTRTGITLMAFGFVIERFGLFLHMFMAIERKKWRDRLNIPVF
jgi:uncharacterized membrane protein YidH (DUF202 family)